MQMAYSVLIASIAAGCCSCNGAGSDGAKTDLPSTGEQTTSEDPEVVPDGDHLPWSVYLRRLRATEGGAWVGKVKGARVIVYLAPPARMDDTYLAVLWESKDPKVRLFEVTEFLVDLEGGVVINLAAVEGHPTLRDPIIVVGRYTDGDFRIDRVRFDRSGSIPAEVTLERGEVDDEVEQLRARFKSALEGE